MLSKKTKYALNALVYIYKSKNESPISVRKISENQNIPLKFLESILSELKNARILNSIQGKYGGYVLNKPAEEINMLQIMRLLDGPIALLPCVSLNFYKSCNECLDEKTCGIRDVAIEIRDITIQKLQSATLAEIVKREEELSNK